ncbi:Uncharacterized protein GBIM_14081 [Gryllus bimaculatus]|nr:Uncharacterized protein GBIM_14081 [Gryllus bimaculatus]
MPPPHRPPLPPPPPPPQALLPRPTPTKTKVLSILERARAAMEETAFACEDDAAAAGGAAPSTFFESAPYDSYGAATGYLPMAHRYGGYDDYDDSAGDYYDSPDVYAGAGRTADGLLLTMLFLSHPTTFVYHKVGEGFFANQCDLQGLLSTPQLLSTYAKDFSAFRWTSNFNSVG